MGQGRAPGHPVLDSPYGILTTASKIFDGRIVMVCLFGCLESK